MNLQFVKMHGIGNDYLFFDCFERPLRAPSDIAVKLSDRHRSVGGDGIVLILPSKKADAKMRMFNADGSEGKMCGNAIRCVAKYLCDLKGVRKDVLTVETRAGIKRIEPLKPRGRVDLFRVDMGKPTFSPDRIPALFEGRRILCHPLIVGGETYRVTCLSMGNPHCVVFCEDPSAVCLERIGPLFEHHPAFPERVNTEFVSIVSKNELKMRVWERGSGETLACGTGACAAAVAAILNGFCEAGEVTVHLKGGDLTVTYTGGNVFMTGPAEISFTGIAEV